MSNPKNSFWNAERDEIIRQMYPIMSCAEIKEKYGWDCKKSLINTRAWVLGVKKAEVVENKNPSVQVKQFNGYRVLVHRMAA